MEAFHVATRLEVEYHDPQTFRFNLNALLAAMHSIEELLQKEVEQHGDITKWNKLRGDFKTDPWLKGIARGRNTTLHQKAIFDGSRVEIGLFRGRRHKLSLGGDVPHDVPSATLLKRWTDGPESGFFLDEKHSAIGEQYGVWRKYYINEISTTEDVLTHLRRGLIRNHDRLQVAHSIYGIETGYLPDEPYLSLDSIARTTVLLESDLDPSLIEKWGW